MVQTDTSGQKDETMDLSENPFGPRTGKVETFLMQKLLLLLLRLQTNIQSTLAGTRTAMNK